jgi:hypothetical protein
VKVVKSGDNPDILSKTLDKDSVIDIDPPLLHASSSTKEGQWQPNEMLSNTEQEETSLGNFFFFSFPIHSKFFYRRNASN